MVDILKKSEDGIGITELKESLKLSEKTTRRYLSVIRVNHPLVDLRIAANVKSKFKILGIL